MMKILSIVGARPEFIQAMPVSKALRVEHQEVLVHTGQHYDYQMSQAFFVELGIPAPDYNLGVGSGPHGRQTGEILSRLEKVLVEEKPDLVIVRGDTNSTLAGSLAASKLHIPSAHVEAGERSYNRLMPEEINRLVADHLAEVHFCASEAAVRRLAEEGITDTVHWVGDVMLDAFQTTLPIAREKSRILEQLNLTPQAYSLVTIHRASNTDNPENLIRIVDALNRVGERVVFPVHPRTRKALKELNFTPAHHLSLIEPVGYLDMLCLEEKARLIATDSGGVQREAYFLSVPCLTLRDETEWIKTVTSGWNQLVGTDPEKILAAWFDFRPPPQHPAIFGDGQAARRIASILQQETISFGQPRGELEARHARLKSLVRGQQP